MARSGTVYEMPRRRHEWFQAVGVVLALASSVVLGCAERQGDLEDDGDELYPVCMTIGGTMGHWADGTGTSILDIDGSAGTACMCMTLEEYQSRELVDELAELVVEECQRLARRYEFESNECRQYYESGIWLPTAVVAAGELEHLNKTGLFCDQEDHVSCELTPVKNLSFAMTPSHESCLFAAMQY